MHRFNRLVQIALVAALFYIGHGLHSRAPGIPTFVSTAQGAGVGELSGNGVGMFIVTQSQDGKTMYMWAFNGVQPQFMGSSKAQ